jgi:hypothetical protein
MAITRSAAVVTKRSVTESRNTAQVSCPRKSAIRRAIAAPTAPASVGAKTPPKSPPEDRKPQDENREDAGKRGKTLI